MKQNHMIRRAFARFTIALTAALLLSPIALLVAQEQPAAASELGLSSRDNAILQRETPVLISPRAQNACEKGGVSVVRSTS